MGESEAPAKRIKLSDEQSDANSLEKLPRELVWKLIEVDPACVLNLRLVIYLN